MADQCDKHDGLFPRYAEVWRLMQRISKAATASQIRDDQWGHFLF